MVAVRLRFCGYIARPTAGWALALGQLSYAIGAYLRRVAAIQEGHLRQRVQELGARLRPASSRPAGDRLSDIRARVLGTR